MKKHEAVEIVRYLNAGFPNQALEHETVVVWTAELERLDAHQAMRAAVKIVRNGLKFPMLAEFMACYRQQREPEHREIEPPAGPRPLPDEVRAWMRSRRLAR